MNREPKRKTWSFLILILAVIMLTGVPVAAASDGAKNYSVFFCTKAGKRIEKLTKKVQGGKCISLPQLPTKNGYTALGWSVDKKKVSYKPGKKIKITKHRTFYALYKKNKECAVRFYNETGKMFKRTVLSGTYLSLPSFRNREGKRFIGWSFKKNQTKNPSFFPEDKIRVTKDLKLYAVLYDDKNEEKTVSPSRQVPNEKKYAGIVFVGDSRTVGLSRAFEDSDNAKQIGNVYFVARGGTGISWFDRKGMSLLTQILDNNKSELPMAVVFNYGVNDIHYKNKTEEKLKAVEKQYNEYFHAIAPKLQDKNCRLFYMSVNPINHAMLFDPKGRTEAEVKAFNEFLQKNLSDAYAYIDTYKWLRNTGYTTWRIESGIDDGLHYSLSTSKRILDYCINRINRS